MNRNKILKLSLYVLFISLFVTDCTPHLSSLVDEKKKVDLNIVLNKIMFESDLLKSRLFERDSNELIYLYPKLKFRKTLFTDKPYGFRRDITIERDYIRNGNWITGNKPSPSLIDSLVKANQLNLDLEDDAYSRTDSLIIPDSLKNTFAYYDNDFSFSDFESPTVYFLSPLLPTIEKNVYLLLISSYTSVLDEPHTHARMASRDFLKYIIIGEDYKYISGVGQSDFFNIGLPWMTE